MKRVSSAFYKALRVSSFGALAFTTACTTAPLGAPAVQTQFVYVDRLVAAVKAVDVPPAPCKTVGTDQETLAACMGKRPADARSALDLALAKILDLVRYVDKADPLLWSATKP